jgi:hypothetical protein
MCAMCRAAMYWTAKPSVLASGWRKRRAAVFASSISIARIRAVV